MEVKDNKSQRKTYRQQCGDRFCLMCKDGETPFDYEVWIRIHQYISNNLYYRSMLYFLSGKNICKRVKVNKKWQNTQTVISIHAIHACPSNLTLALYVLDLMIIRDSQTNCVDSCHLNN